ncbi:MAG: electron transfer flavoprotein subunit alpha/FixB family protein [Chloroflexi bacterium]|nr:electron transfer flavoprotein subunit alpha/FixB family protein [Chloroflexota bacterium]
MSNHILVVAETSDGRFTSITYQVLGEVARLAGLSLSKGGGAVEVVVLGSGVHTAADLGALGASKIYVADDPSFAKPDAALVAPTVLALIKRTQPEAVFMGATALGMGLAPRLATHLQCALTSDCTAFAMEDGQIRVTRPVYGGRAVAVYQPKKLPLIATLRQNAFAPAAANGAMAASVEALTVVPAQNAVKVVETTKSAVGKIGLNEANIVVTGGRGMQGPDNFALVEELASVLGAATGATRAVVDAGWRPYGEQVGQTGKTVSPSLYVAAGVSGAMQHLVGMKTSKVIVAINKDPEAPIFKVADYGIVGDALKVLPALTAEMKKLKEQG